MILKNTKWTEEESMMANAFINIANSLPYIQQMMKQHVKSAQNGGGIINDGDLQEVLNQLAEMINKNLHNVSQSRVSFTMTPIAQTRTPSQQQTTTANESYKRIEKIRLTESQLRKVIRESVKKVLREGFGDKTFSDSETQERLKQDMIDMYANLDNERFMKHFNNRLQIDDPDVLDALWREYANRKGLR